MIKYISYERDGGVKFYDGYVQFEEFAITDIIAAINCRIRSIPERKSTLAYNQHCEETCFLVRLCYDFDKLKQYLERNGDRLILNFCNLEMVSLYSITFSKLEKVSKETLCEKSHYVKFSNQIAAPLLTLKEVKEKIPKLYFFSSLKIGRGLFKNNLYYHCNEIGFCLPVEQLIDSMVVKKSIDNYVKDINIKLDNDANRINIHVTTSKSAYGKKHWENEYFGYLDLSELDFVIERHEKELSSS